MNVSYKLGVTAFRIVAFLAYATALTAKEPALALVTDPVADYMDSLLKRWPLPRDTSARKNFGWHVTGGAFTPVGGILERYGLPARKGHELPKLLFIRNWADGWLDLGIRDVTVNAGGLWYAYLCDEKGQWHRQFDDLGDSFGASVEGINDEGPYYRYLKIYRGRFPSRMVPSSFQSGIIENGKVTIHPDAWPKGFRPFQPHRQWITVADYVSQPHPKWHQDEVPTEEEPLAELIKHTKVFSLEYLQKWFAEAAAGKPPAKPKK